MKEGRLDRLLLSRASLATCRPITEDAARAAAHGENQPGDRARPGAARASERFLPVHSTPLHSGIQSIITACDDDDNCTEIQSDLPTDQRSHRPPSLPPSLPLSAVRRASIYSSPHSVCLCIQTPRRDGGTDATGQVKTNSEGPFTALSRLSRLSWLGPSDRPSDRASATLPFLRYSRSAGNNHRIIIHNSRLKFNLLAKERR